MSDKSVTIIINGREEVVTKSDISFAELVELAYGHPPEPNPKIKYTITFKRGHGDKPEGILVEGESVKVKEGMIFNVKRTDKS